MSSRGCPHSARPRRAIWSEHVSGAMSSGHRDRVLLRFRDFAPDELGLLSNARCLGEGVDVPSLDGVAFIDPRRSTIDIIQAVGRAIRKAPTRSSAPSSYPSSSPTTRTPTGARRVRLQARLGRAQGVAGA